jgi:ribosome-associated protein
LGGRRARDDNEIVSDYNDVAIEDESIKLGQFLKLANLIDSGGEAKHALAGGIVRVNGEIETRRGRQLERGDVVSVAAKSARVGGARDWE